MLPDRMSLSLSPVCVCLCGCDSPSVHLPDDPPLCPIKLISLCYITPVFTPLFPSMANTPAVGTPPRRSLFHSSYFLALRSPPLLALTFVPSVSISPVPPASYDFSTGPAATFLPHSAVHQHPASLHCSSIIEPFNLPTCVCSSSWVLNVTEGLARVSDWLLINKSVFKELNSKPFIPVMVCFSCSCIAHLVCCCIFYMTSSWVPIGSYDKMTRYTAAHPGWESVKIEELNTSANKASNHYLQYKSTGKRQNRSRR